MCTTVGFSYKEGIVFGRTLEIGVKLENNILFVPRNEQDFINAKGVKYDSKYSTIGSAFFDIPSFGDGINEEGLMGSSNFFPNYGTFSKDVVEGKINMTTSNAFDYLLTRCKDIDEVKEEIKNIILIEKIEDDVSMSNHFFFMDATGNKIVLEPKDGKFLAYDNPYGVLTNSPEFPWHVTNLKNYIHLKSGNIDETDFNGNQVSKLGEGTGMLGLPGDFTPPSRFIRAAYFVSNTDKNLERKEALLQGFRILSQFDIPKGAVIDGKEGHTDETLYTSVMDTKNKAYYIKCFDNINIQSFCLEDYRHENKMKFIKLVKTMDL